MRPTSLQCIRTSRSALYRVLGSPAEPALRRACAPRAALGRSGAVGDQLRLFRTTAQAANGDWGSDGDERGLDRRYMTQEVIDRLGRDRLPRDHEITDPYIMVIDGAAAQGPLATSYVLSKLEPEESLRMLQPFLPPDVTEGRPEPQFAVCKVVNKRQEYERQRQLKEKAKNSKTKIKEIEFTWSIDPHDLDTKMRQMKAFLSKGIKVEVVLGRKKRGRVPTDDEMAAVLRRVRDEVASLGGREHREATGDVGDNLRLFFVGKGVS